MVRGSGFSHIGDEWSHTVTAATVRRHQLSHTLQMKLIWRLGKRVDIVGTSLWEAFDVMNWHQKADWTLGSVGECRVGVGCGCKGHLLSVCLSVCLPACRSVCPYVYIHVSMVSMPLYISVHVFCMRGCGSWQDHYRYRSIQ